MSDDVIIKVKNLSKTFKLYQSPKHRLLEALHPFRKKYHHEYHALKDISFEIKKGESVGILGKNGAGKSTLLKILTGVMGPTTGAVKLNGRIAALLELGSGFNPELSGMENIFFQGAIIGISKDEMADKVKEIVEFADIGEFIDQPVKTYSSGMFARLAFSIAINVDPDILIVDEALSVGDMRFQVKCMSKMKKLQDEKKVIIYVSHDMDSIKNLCQTAIYLDSGRILSFGTGPEIAEQYIRHSREETNQTFGVTDSIQNFENKSRLGSGNALITKVEFLDENGNAIDHAEFDQEVHIKIHFISLKELEVSANYYIQDDKKNLVLGAGLGLLGVPYIKAKPGLTYVVTYKTKLPLSAGTYSSQIQLTSVAIPNQAAVFHDVMDDSFVFKVAERRGCRIWTKFFVNNEVMVETYDAD